MGNDTTIPAPRGFLDGCYIHGDIYNGASTLVSFHFVRYILFTVMMTIAGPLVYRMTAAFFDLERDFKAVADHFDDLTNGLIYTYIVFTLGNYAHTFGWVTAVFYFVGLLGYSVLVELPFMRVSLPGWRQWGKKAWVVNLVGLALVLVAAAFHIRWAYLAGILAWYLSLFVLATSTVWCTIIISKIHHHCAVNRPEGLGFERRIRRVALGIIANRGVEAQRRREQDQIALRTQLRARAEEHAATNQRPCDYIKLPDSTADVGIVRRSQLNMPAECDISSSSSSSATDSTSENSEFVINRESYIEDRLRRLHYLNVRSHEPLPLRKYCLHLHHWQIFYILAFFTRFDVFASRACAGIVLGIVTQGSAAYGFDAMMERKGEYQ